MQLLTMSPTIQTSNFGIANIDAFFRRAHGESSSKATHGTVARGKSSSTATPGTVARGESSSTAAHATPPTHGIPRGTLSTRGKLPSRRGVRREYHDPNPFCNHQYDYHFTRYDLTPCEACGM